MVDVSKSGRVRVISDSGSDLDRDFAKSRGIVLLPLGVEMGEEQFMDRVDLSPKELFTRMRDEKATPRTFQVAPGAFREEFESAVASGESPVCICFSSKLSGTYQSALMAAREVPGTVVIDSQGASLGEGLMVLAAQEMADAGASGEAIADRVRWMSARMEHLFCVDSLEYLHRGGRISHTKAIVGSLLSIRPVLHFVEGAIFPLENTRSRKRAFARILDIMAERSEGAATQTIGISHADDPDGAAELQELVRARFGCTGFLISEVGATSGSHAGPGTIALFFLGSGQGGTTAAS